MIESTNYIILPRLKEQMNQLEGLLFAALWLHRDNKTGICFPSNETLCKITGFSDKTVTKYLKTLQEKGYIYIYNQPKRGCKNGRNRYKLPMPEKDYEIASQEFVKTDLLTKEEKMHIIAVLPHLYKKPTGTGDTSYSISELHKLTGLTMDSIKKVLCSLQKKGLVTIINSRWTDLNILGMMTKEEQQKLPAARLEKLLKHKARVENTGLKQQIIYYDLDAIMHPDKIFLRQTEQRLETLESHIDSNDFWEAYFSSRSTLALERCNTLQQENEQLIQQNAQLKEELARFRAQVASLQDQLARANDWHNKMLDATEFYY